MNARFVTVRHVVAPVALAAITVVGTLGWSAVAHAGGRADAAASGEAMAGAAPSHPHGVMASPRAVGSSFRSSSSRAASGSSRAALPAHGGYGASSGAAHAGRNYRTR